jgi:CRISPR system Cascade subunit CasA
LLKTENDRVTGFILLGGDVFDKENAFIENMTMWRRDKDNDQAYNPRRHSVSKQFWREFASLTVQNGTRQPGIVMWLATLKQKKMCPEAYIKLQTAAVVYGDKDFFVNDIISDALMVNAALLRELGADWGRRIADELAKTEECVRAYGALANDLAIAAGGDRESWARGKDPAAKAKEAAYFALDEPFRVWLAGIDPDMEAASATDYKSDTMRAWLDQMARLIRGLARAMTEAVDKTKSFELVVRANTSFENEMFKILEKGER